MGRSQKKRRKILFLFLPGRYENKCRRFCQPKMLKAVYFHAARTQLFLDGDGAEEDTGLVGWSAGWTGGTVFYGQLFYGVPLTVANGVAKHATRSWFCGSTLVDFYITVSWMLLAHLCCCSGWRRTSSLLCHALQ